MSPAKRAMQIGGIVLAVIIIVFVIFYAIKYIPNAIARLSGTVYLAQDGAGEITEEGVSTTTVDTVRDETNDSQDTTPTTNTPATTSAPETPRTGGPLVTPTTRTYTYYQGPVTPRLYGLSDLSVDITAVGYLNSSNVTSFRVDDEVPSGKRPAMKFTVTNKGTNVSGTWRLKVDLPTGDEEYTFNSQESLLPGARKNYTIYFDEADEGNNQRMRVEVDYRNDVAETNENNNTDVASIDIN